MSETANRRRLVIGDVHANFKLLEIVLEKAAWNPETDTLYSLGDFCDRGRHSVEVLRFMMENNVKAVIGNHDLFLEYWLRTGEPNRYWRGNGQDDTIWNFERNEVDDAEKKRILDWLHTLPLSILLDDYIITHAGPRPLNGGIEELINPPDWTKDPLAYLEDEDSLVWNRHYIASALIDVDSAYKFELPTDMWHNYDEKGKMITKVFPPIETDKTFVVGHTPVVTWKPFIDKDYHIIALDTGAGKGHALTIMDLDTKEYWQADSEDLRKRAELKHNSSF